MNSAKESFKLTLGRWIFLFLFSFSLADGRVTSRRPPDERRNIFSEPVKTVPGPEKNYTEIRVKDDSILLVYYHEQTVAIVETDENRTLYNCELLEVKTKLDRQVTLNNLKPLVPTQEKIALPDMLDLMTRCQKLDTPPNLGKEFINEKIEEATTINPNEFTSIFSGLFPGTKWCGLGDAAGSYYDLGKDASLDKCCRNHDLCPVKVLGLKSSYNLTNDSIYTRSHCLCDQDFYNCLKSTNTTTTNLVGNLYFNVAPLTCVDDVPYEESGLKTKKEFITITNKSDIIFTAKVCLNCGLWALYILNFDSEDGGRNITERFPLFSTRLFNGTVERINKTMKKLNISCGNCDGIYFCCIKFDV